MSHRQDWSVNSSASVFSFESLEDRHLLSIAAPGGLDVRQIDLATGSADVNYLTITFTDNASNETGYKVERSRDGENFGEIASVAGAAGTGTQISFIDTPFEQDRKYTYRARAYNATEISLFSNEDADKVVPDAIKPTNGTIRVPRQGTENSLRASKKMNLCRTKCTKIENFSSLI